jgi:hypothetical protein
VTVMVGDDDSWSLRGNPFTMTDIEPQYDEDHGADNQEKKELLQHGAS